MGLMDREYVRAGTPPTAVGTAPRPTPSTESYRTRAVNALLEAALQIIVLLVAAVPILYVCGKLWWGW